MSMKAQTRRSITAKIEALDFYNQAQAPQHNERGHDDAPSEGSSHDYVVIMSDSILCVSSKAQADGFRGNCAEQHIDEETQSFIG